MIISAAVYMPSLCFYIQLVDDNSCSVIQQGQQVEYDLENSTVTFYFGPIAATFDTACSLNDSMSFEACKLIIMIAVFHDVHIIY